MKRATQIQLLSTRATITTRDIFTLKQIIAICLLVPTTQLFFFYSASTMVTSIGCSLDLFTSSTSVTALPATLTKLIQYRFPLESGRLCPRCVPCTLTASPLRKVRTWSQFTSASRKDGHPCALLSLSHSSQVRLTGAVKRGFPVLES